MILLVWYKIEHGVSYFIWIMFTSWIMYAEQE